MSNKKGVVLKGILIAGSLALVVAILALALFPGVSRPLAMPIQEPTTSLSVFSAPSHLPPGEHWVLIGSFAELPEDLAASPAAAGVNVLETQKLSKRAVGVRLEVGLGAVGKLLRVSSASRGTEAYPDLYRGETPPSCTADANFMPEDFVDGYLVVDGQHFIYGYYPASQAPLAATRIHNRSTGTWHCHEIAVEKARAASEVPVPVGPEFVEVDPFVTFPDTDGDGVPDFAEEPDAASPTPEQVGVELVPNANVLDLVTADEAGNVSWRTLNVFTTFTPEAQ